MHVMAKAKDWPTCVNGVWQFHASKYDQTITPENVCIPNGRWTMLCFSPKEFLCTIEMQFDG